MEGPLVVAFGAASRFFAEAVGLVPATAWTQSGLGNWSLVELVAHGNRAHTTLEEYLLRPRPPEPAGSSYFSDQAVAERGREAVAALGTDPLPGSGRRCPSGPSPWSKGRLPMPQSGARRAP